MKVAVLPSDLAKCVGMPLDEAECGSTSSRNIPPGNNNNDESGDEDLLISMDDKINTGEILSPL